MFFSALDFFLFRFHFFRWQNFIRCDLIRVLDCTRVDVALQLFIFRSNGERKCLISLFWGFRGIHLFYGLYRGCFSNKARRLMLVFVLGFAYYLKAPLGLSQAFLNDGLFAGRPTIFDCKHDVLCHIFRHGWLTNV